VPGITLDEVFASQSGIAAAVKQELDADMAGFGYEIVNVLVTDIVPDAKVKSAMNDINAAQREQVAANARGEAEKILVVKKAEAEAQSKALQGQGIANQRKAIIEGLQGSIEQFQKTVAGASTADVMQLVMITQYFDTIKSIGEMDKTNTLFLSHSPTAVRDISEQIMQSMLVADRGEELAENPTTSTYPPLFPRRRESSGYVRLAVKPFWVVPAFVGTSGRRAHPYPASAVSASRTQYEVPTGIASSLKS
jgi:hypothetical protein